MQHGFTKRQVKKIQRRFVTEGEFYVYRGPHGEELDTPLSPVHFMEFPKGDSPIPLRQVTARDEQKYLHNEFGYPTPSPTPQALTETYVATEAVAQQFPNMQWGTPQAVRDTRRDLQLSLMAVVDGKAYHRAEAPTPNCSRDVLLTATTEGYVFEECNSPVEDQRRKRRRNYEAGKPRPVVLRDDSD